MPKLVKETLERLQTRFGLTRNEKIPSSTLWADNSFSRYGAKLPRRWDEGSVAIVLATLVVALCTRGTHSCRLQPAHEAITTTTPLLICVPAVHIHVVANPQKVAKPSPLTPKHKQQQPKSDNPLIDNLPSLCLEGLLTHRGAHREHASFLRFSIHISAIPIENPLSR
jgi:hypothetical protein